MAGNKGKKIIAIDIGGTNVRVSLVKDKKILKYIKKPTPKTTQEIIKELFSLIDSLIDKDVKGIGIGCPGPLKNGVIQSPPNLPFRNFNLKKTIQDKYKIKTIVDNDAKCVALAEYNYGFKKKDFIVLTIGTGIGGGIFINGKLYRGSSGYGGELGHIIIDNGKTFEEFAASKNLKKLTYEAFGKEMLIKELFKIKNNKAKKILDELSEYIGQGIGSLINIFDPEIVVISGGIKENGPAFLNMIRKKAGKYSILPKKTRIEWIKLDHPGTLGASLLIK